MAYSEGRDKRIHGSCAIYCIFLSFVKGPSSHCVLPSLSPAIKVRWANENESKICGSIDRAVAEQFSDYTSRRLSHWRKQYERYDWESVPDGVAAKCSQLPNQWRKRGGTAKGPNPKTYNMSPAVEVALRDQVDSLIVGEHECMPRTEHVTKADLNHTMRWLLEEVNKEVECEQEVVEGNNKELVDAFQRGDITMEELAQEFREEPKRVQAKSVRHLVDKFTARQSYSKQALNTSGNYLSFNDERMKQILAFSIAIVLALL